MNLLGFIHISNRNDLDLQAVLSRTDRNLLLGRCAVQVRVEGRRVLRAHPRPDDRPARRGRSAVRDGCCGNMPRRVHAGDVRDAPGARRRGVSRGAEGQELGAATRPNPFEGTLHANGETYGSPRVRLRIPGAGRLDMATPSWAIGLAIGSPAIPLMA